MDENRGNLKPLQIINPITGRKIFVGTATYKSLQAQGLIPKDQVFNAKKQAKEPLFKVMNKLTVKPKCEAPPRSKKKVESPSSSDDDDDDDALDKILARTKSVVTKKSKRQPTPQPSSDSESDSESSESESSDD